MYYRPSGYCEITIAEKSGNEFEKYSLDVIDKVGRSLSDGNISIFIQINQPIRCINLSDLFIVVQIQLNMFRASSCPSSGAYKLQ